MDLIKKIAKKLNLETKQVENTVKLFDDGASVPFISRYRKEVTGNLNEDFVKDIETLIKYLRNLEERKEEIIRLITEQEKMTDELLNKITLSEKLQEIEEIYAPFKKKKKTKADIAIENGLEPLSIYFYTCNDRLELEEKASKFINENIETIENAIDGAKLIIAKGISEDIEYRDQIRKLMKRRGILKSTATKKNIGKDEKNTYEIYYDFKELVINIPNHRVLAINRGEKEKILSVKILFEEMNYEYIVNLKVNNFRNDNLKPLFKEIITDALDRLILPSIEREVRNFLTEKAEDSAMSVFQSNLKSLLMQPPLKDMNLLGIDPGYRTGCKVVVVDSKGFFIENDTIYLLSQNSINRDKEKILKYIIKYKINLVSIGNGTASRETEKFIIDIIKENNLKDVKYVITNEAGASIYSASKTAKDEFPDLDLTVRGAISIARRVQDPLAELVKITPESIGVGMYQHDMSVKKLKESLAYVVESCVNNVGVNVNTASHSLLEYVSGMKKNVAKNILEYRKENGDFKNRKAICKVKGVGAKLYQQCVGFLVVPNSDNPLDETIIHPESYHIAKLILKKAKTSLEELQNVQEEFVNKLKDFDIELFISENEFGKETVYDIYNAILKERRDPRDNYPQPILKQDLVSIKDLKTGMVLEGTVRNVIDFGAFVDIGLKNDALLHISEISKKRVTNPMEVLSVGDIIKSEIIKIDEKRGRVSLSMKNISQ